MSIARPISQAMTRPVNHSLFGGERLDRLRALIADLFGAGQQGVIPIPKPVVLGKQRLFQDVAETVPVEFDGDPVRVMIECSPHEHRLAAPSDLARPVYRTDGALHWLEFDGVDDLLMYEYSSPIIQPNTFGTAFRPRLSGTDEQGYFGAISSSGSSRQLIYTISAGQRWFAGVTFDSFDIVPDQETVLVGTFNSTSSYVKQDGSTPVAGDVGSNSRDGEVIGAQYSDGLGSYANMDFYGAISISSGLGSSSEVANLESYLADLAGITL